MHEYTHTLQVEAPKEYKLYKQAVKDAFIQKHGQEEYDATIKAIIDLYGGFKTNGKKKSKAEQEDLALDEMVADVAREFLNDENFVKNITSEHLELGQKILDAIRNIISKIRYLIAFNGNQFSASLYAELDNMKELETLWMDAVQAAKKQDAQDKVDMFSLGYHAGDLGKSTVDDYEGQGYGRGTGHFGFGTYFVGNEAQINDFGFEKRPHFTVDFDKYNLYRPKDFNQALNLHDGLKIVDGYAKYYSELKDADIETKINYRRNIEKAIENYEWNIPQDISQIAEDDRWIYESDAEEYANGKAAILDFVKSMDEYDRDNIEYKGEKEYNELNMSEDEAREKFTNDEREWREWINKDHPGVTFENTEEEAVENDLEKWRERKEADKLLDKDDFIVRNAIKIIPKHLDRQDNHWNRVGRVVDYLLEGLGYSHSSKEIDEALRKTEMIVNEYEPGKRGYDSAATVFMKQLGYEGVDVRHISGMDNTGYGSVIYDLKGEDLAKKNEIGTAKYSIVANMSPAERYEELKDKNIYVIESLKKNLPLSNMEFDVLKSRKMSEAKDAAIVLVQSLGVVGTYTNQDIEFDFEFSNNGIKESAHKQFKIKGDDKYVNFVNLMANLDSVIKTAHLIEKHDEDYYIKHYDPEHTRNEALRYTYVLVSSFMDEDSIIPVKLTIMEYKQGSGPKLHVAIATDKIKKSEVDVKPLIKSDGVATPIYDVKLSQLLRAVNDEALKKYIPKQFYQQNSEAMVQQDSDYMDAVARGDMETAQRMVDEAARNAGWDSQRAYHGTGEYFNAFEDIHMHKWNAYGQGFYFTTNYERATRYVKPSRTSLNAGRVIASYINQSGLLDSRDQRGIENLCHAFGMTLQEIEKWADDNGYGGGSLFYVANYADDHGINFKNKVIEAGYKGLIVHSSWSDDVEYVLYDSSQAKSANPVTYDDNGHVIPLSERFNEENPDIRYSIGGDAQVRFALEKPIEETRDLIAVHNLKEDDIRGTLQLGGFPMPSIAVIKAEDGHNMYGPYSAVFGKETIGPEYNRNNQIFGADAWTPTFPSLSYKVNDGVLRDAFNTIKELIGEDVIRQLGGRLHVGLEPDDVSRKLEGYNGDASAIADNNTAMMAAYLKHKGIEPNYATHEAALDGFHTFKNSEIIGVAEAIGRDNVFAMNDGSIDIRDEGVQEHLMKALNDWCEKEFGVKDLYDKKDFSFSTADKLVSAMSRYYIDGVKTTIDEYDSRPRFKEQIGDMSDYQNWVKELLHGVVDKVGIRNNIDLFTPSGNRRSWDVLYDDFTLDNVVKSMKLVKNGEAMFGDSLFAIAQKQYKNIKDVIADKDRLRKIPEEEYVSIRKEIEDRYSDVVSWFDEKLILNSHDNPFIIRDEIRNIIADAIRTQKTKEGILKELQQYWCTKSATMDIVDRIAQIVKDSAELPTGYFEAKPRRAVRFDEIYKLIVPDDIPSDLEEKLVNNDVDLVKYESGNEEDRKSKLNSFDEIKFSFSGYEPVSLSKKDYKIVRQNVLAYNSKIRNESEQIINYTFTDNYFVVYETWGDDSFRAIYKLHIEGNENYIKEISDAIKQDEENLDTVIESVRTRRRGNNRNNAAIKGRYSLQTIDRLDRSKSYSYTVGDYSSVNGYSRDTEINNQLDHDYFTAINEGRMDDVEKMVKKAAKQAGYTTEAYHGAKMYFDEFKPESYFADTKLQGWNWVADSRKRIQLIIAIFACFFMF